MRGLISKKVIRGCEGRGDADSPYLTRYSFPRLGLFRAALHVFHRSDHDEMHDHPWPFVSIILWRGYVEETPSDQEWRVPTQKDWDERFWGRPGVEYREDGNQIRFRRRKRVYPGMILFRRAEHVHRVDLVEGKRAVTLVVMGPYVRQWGFWTRKGWEHWRSYFERLGC
jgi:hypothetical protein